MDSFEAIPHLPGSQLGDDDVALTSAEAAPFFDEEVVVLEKVDGINLVLRREGRRVRGLMKQRWRSALDGRVQRAIDLWIRQREAALRSAIPAGYDLTCEWLWHQVSLSYDRLPGEVLAFGARDRSGRPLPFFEARPLIAAAGLPENAPLFEGRLGDARRLRSLVGQSHYASSKKVRMEGLVLQRAPEHDELWAKWVEPGFVEVGPHELSGAKNRVLDERIALVARR